MGNEFNPAPTPSRSIYGFVIFLLFSTLFILYVLWAFIPLDVYENHLGITELPNKYFALFLPILVLTATTLFAFFIYPSFSFIMTSDINSINTVTDSSAIKRCRYRDTNGVLCDNKVQQQLDNLWRTPTECDNHQNRESKVSNYCDCKDKSKCMLANGKGHIEALWKQDQMQNSADLDVYEVSQILYAKRHKN